ncbi:hypothetical protein OJAV_G00007080 [Oryzias javanicus]|uniref:Secretory calcium-binding phosphoprotein 7 n=1 Tax=Oryzias javanicus TaxID=123683 RepID=A0A437DMZ1_ORYJA|nr:hypothetical protein OJAV_G00007080 [Oryzias javanicus]
MPKEQVSQSKAHPSPPYFAFTFCWKKKLTSKMKFILVVSCLLGVAFCAPKPQGYKEFDIYHAPAEAAQAIPAGAPAGTLEVLLPVNSLRQPIGGAVSGFIKQEIPRGNGEDDEVYYPFGFNVPAPAAPAAAADPVLQFWSSLLSRLLYPREMMMRRKMTESISIFFFFFFFLLPREPTGDWRRKACNTSNPPLSPTSPSFD